ncbi:hypothetical protein [uncultured Faecalibaculum sp.]|uniref:hypothetical protein n=1 Tax=uncultured Faecalibaculum sp. TaxID=1729681 RepID=UPI00272DF534|nr:hypothetical protein [uncultured Faecalibaculum sp.]
MTDSKKEKIIQAVKDMRSLLTEAKREAKNAADIADEAESWAFSASSAACSAEEQVKDAEKKLQQLMDLLDEEVRP